MDLKAQVHSVHKWHEKKVVTRIRDLSFNIDKNNVRH
jgi:hypothetical protein